MNETLSKIKAKADGARASVAEEKDSSLEMAQRLHQAALPLLKAFADIQDNFVKIEALKRIWPSDYERRPDRVRGLVIAVHGGETYPSGLMFHAPGGVRSFEVRETWDGRLTYVSSREASGARPLFWQFDAPEPWLDGFYQTMAIMLEL